MLILRWHILFRPHSHTDMGRTWYLPTLACRHGTSGCGNHTGTKRNGKKPLLLLAALLLFSSLQLWTSASCVRSCMCAQLCLDECMNAGMGVCKAHARTCMCACACAFVHGACARVHACACMCVHACLLCPLLLQKKQWQ